MRILVRIALSGPARALVGDPTLALPAEASWAEYWHDAPELLRILEKSASGLRMLMVPRAKFSEEEVDETEWFEIFPSRTLAGAMSEMDRTRNLLDNTPRSEMGGRVGTGVRLLKFIERRSVRVGAAEIRRVCDDIAEYVVGDRVTEAFKAAGLSGWKTGQMTNAKTGEPFAGVGRKRNGSLGPVGREADTLVDRHGRSGVLGVFRVFGLFGLGGE
jgi:hypothetical protein